MQKLESHLITCETLNFPFGSFSTGVSALIPSFLYSAVMQARLRARICGTLCCCPDGPNEDENKRLRGFIFASGEERDGGESRSRDRRSSRSVRGDEGFPVRSEQSFSKDRLHQRAYVNLLGQISICCAKPGGRDEDKSDTRPVADRVQRGRA